MIPALDCPGGSTALGRYDRRRPENTVLYRAVAQNLRTFIEMTGDQGTLPRFVRRDLERYLGCGILANGFARVRCKQCGDMLAVAFSCKARSCPSCQSRTMAQTAAHLVEHVLPPVPIRHVVLTLPIPIRLRLANDPETTSAVLGCFIQVLGDWLRERSGIAVTPDDPAQIGAVTRIHRGASDLRLNVHFHTLVTSGLFVRRDRSRGGGLEFVPIDEPSRDEVLALELAVARSIVRLLERRGILAEGRIVLDVDEVEILDRCRAAAATGRIAFGPQAGEPVEREGAFEPGWGSARPRRPHGFDLFLGSPVEDRVHLERLCRYIARPPVPEGRLSWREDGRVRLELPRPWADGTLAVVLDPLDLLSRLAALVPRPFQNLTRYHGVLAPNAAWRNLVIPAAGRRIPRRRTHHTSGGRWIPWHELMRRTFQLDLLRCPCGGKREVVAYITQPETIRAILESIGLPTEPPEIATSWWSRGQELWS